MDFGGAECWPLTKSWFHSNACDCSLLQNGCLGVQMCPGICFAQRILRFMKGIHHLQGAEDEGCWLQNWAYYCRPPNGLPQTPLVPHKIDSFGEEGHIWKHEEPVRMFDSLNICNGWISWNQRSQWDDYSKLRLCHAFYLEWSVYCENHHFFYHNFSPWTPVWIWSAKSLILAQVRVFLRFQKSFPKGS